MKKTLGFRGFFKTIGGMTPGEIDWSRGVGVGVIDHDIAEEARNRLEPSFASSIKRIGVFG